MKNVVFAMSLGLTLVACGGKEEPVVEQEAAPVEVAEPTESYVEEMVAPEPQPGTDNERLAAVLAAQPEDRQARYRWRHPQETLEFFNIAPGMTVVEILPGGGWYSPILVAYLGKDGHLIGADYPLDLWPNFPFASEEFMERRRNWPATWTASAAEWAGEDGATAEATRIGEIPEAMAGTVDAVLFIRALHNLKRFEGKGGFLSTALSDAMTLLKSGGVVGVVQHRAPDERSDEWADGSRGYLKKSDVIARFEDAGFRLVEQSNVNANPADQPEEEDIVWRLPPSLNTSREDPVLRAQYEAIGESNRMTLLFEKP
jgi:predicted methyltransferase